MHLNSVESPITRWKCTGSRKQRHPALELRTGTICPLCKQEVAALSVQKMRVQPKWWAAGAAALFLVGGSGYTITQVMNACPNGQQRQENICYTPELFSSGERLLFGDKLNADLQRGVDAFGAARYAEAEAFFENAAQADRFEPEPQIYLNNAKARQSQQPPLVLAAVIPVDSRADQAKEVLRGIADAQTQFNQAGGSNGRLLEILIVNDNNRPDQSTQVAQRLALMPNVLGVIGHNASSASLAGLTVYQNADPPLAMISSTSSSVDLRGDNFFRTVPSDQASGEALATYLKNELEVDQTAIFFNPKDSYSRSITTAFEQKFRQLGGRVVRKINLSDAQLNVETELRKLQNDNVSSALLFPNTGLTSVAVRVARANADQSEPLLLLGSDSLYSQDTLKAGGSAVKGLILPVSWFADRQPYARVANRRWGGRVSWRTAASFDATQAFIRAFAGSTPNRTTVLNQLRSVSISASQTSGAPLRFSRSGEILREPLLVEVTRRPGARFDFQPIPLVLN